MKSDPTTVPIVVSVELVGEKTFNTVKIVECASISNYSRITIVRLGNI